MTPSEREREGGDQDTAVGPSRKQGHKWEV
jgi:hypothetical protein